MVLLLLLAALTAVLCLAGFPPGIRDAALRRLNRDRRYMLEVSAVRLRFPFGLYFDQPRVYRRGTAGPPIAEADRVALKFNPIQWRLRRTGIRSILVDGGVIRRYPRAKDIPEHPASWRLPDGEQGKIKFRRLEITGMPLDLLSANYQVEGSRLWLSDLHAVLDDGKKTGTLTGHGALHLPERRYNGYAEGHVNPRSFIPLARAWRVNAGPLLENFASADTGMEIHLRFNGSLIPPYYDFSGNGGLTAQQFRYRDIPVKAAIVSGSVDYDGTATGLDIRQAAAVLEDGVISGNARCALTAGEAVVYFEGTTSPLTPIALIGLTAPEALRETRFAGPTRWEASGPVSYRGGDKTDLRLKIENGPLTWRGFSADRLDLAARYKDDILDFKIIEASLMAGSAEGSVLFDFQSPDMPPAYRLALKIDGIASKRLIAGLPASADPESHTGILKAEINGKGTTGGGLEALNAEGRLRIRDGRLYRLPLFGGLSRILSRIIPGLDIVLMQTSARADFAIAEKMLTVDDVRIEGEVFNLEGRGVHALGGELDFYVQLKLLKDQTLLGSAVRTLTLPLSKLFEFRLRGTLDDPRWYPVNFSPDLIRRLRDIID